MSNESILLPKTAFADLDLHDGDIVEGRVVSESVEVRVVRCGNQENGGMTGADFVTKWRARFPNVADGMDPRLDALLEKHVKPA